MRFRRLPFRIVLGHRHAGHGGPCFVFVARRRATDAAVVGWVVVDMIEEDIANAVRLGFVV
jgi:hypothetical protein